MEQVRRNTNIEKLDPSEELRTYEIRERYYAVASCAKQLINSRISTSSSNPPTKPIIAPMTITLPEMKLPTFDGAPEACTFVLRCIHIGNRSKQRIHTRPETAIFTIHTAREGSRVYRIPRDNRCKLHGRTRFIEG